MSADVRRCYRFASFLLDPEQRTLLRDGTPVSITPKVFDLLLALVENAGRLVTKQELLARVWPDTFVEEANLSVHVSVLRKVLGDETIETVPKSGYRFVAPVVEERDNRRSGETGDPLAVVPTRRMVPAGALSGGRRGYGRGSGCGGVSARHAHTRWPSRPSRIQPAIDWPLLFVNGLTRAVASRLSGVSPKLAVMTVARSNSGISTAQDAVALGRSLGVDASSPGGSSRTTWTGRSRPNWSRSTTARCCGPAIIQRR
jgi:DNA-binding winged helix-turn-helix (wHTH) protein